MTTTTSVGPIDVNSLVSQLMSVESQPLTQLQKQESQINAQISAYGTLSSSLSSFQTAMKGLGDLTKFQVYTAASSDNTVLTATASSTATVGSHTVQVLRAAEQHNLSSSNSFTASATLAAGLTATITVGSSPFTVNIGGMTLAQAASAINAASNNAGATATVVNVNSGYKLLLTANNTGSTNALSVSYNGTDPFAMATVNQIRDGSPPWTPASLDAVMVLDGSSSLTATRSSNTVTDLIGGVTLNLVKAGTVTVSTARDNTSVTKSAQAIVDAYNALHSALNTLSTGGLKGDNSLRSIQSNILSVINTPPTALTGSYSYLSQVGLSIQKDGTMALDSAALTAALNTNFSGVANLFANNNQGYAYRLANVATQMLASNGLITSTTDGLSANLNSVKNSETAMQGRLSLIQKSYMSQFTALNDMLSSMQTTSNYLTQQLANLPGYR